MCVLLFVFVCSTASATAAPVGVEGTDAKTPIQSAKVLAYASCLDSLDKNDVNSVSKAADYFQENLMQASESECIAAAVCFDAFFNSFDGTLNRKHWKEWENTAAAEAFQKAHGAEYLKNGLALQWCDSGLGCFVSPDAPQTVFKPFTQCSAPQVRAYYALPSGTHGDPGYSGSFSELATDIGERELFLAEFPNSAFSEKVTARRDRKRILLFLGGSFLF